MSTRILIDNFVGDPDDLYSLLIEEVNLRALPEIEFNFVEEAESEKRLFNKGDKAKALRIAFKTENVVVFAYQIGRCFFVSTRLTHRFHEATKSTYLYDVQMFTFERVVDRATKRALARYLESKNASVPSFLVASDNAELSEQTAQS